MRKEHGSSHHVWIREAGISVAANEASLNSTSAIRAIPVLVMLMVAFAQPGELRAQSCGDGTCESPFIYGSCAESSKCCPDQDNSCYATGSGGMGGIGPIGPMGGSTCYCDEACVNLFDCCPDYLSYCEGNGTPPPTHAPGSTYSENCETCPEDCPYCCGDGECLESSNESCQTCSWDCFCPWCGDNICSLEEGESCETCPIDCSCCGDAQCDSGETCSSCEEDCGECLDCAGVPGGNATFDACGVCDDDPSNDCILCGDGACEGDENCATCSQDCGDCCGDGTCTDAHEEECESCPTDCGECPVCGDNDCNGNENCESCPEDCGFCCGDGTCDPNSESCSTCSTDCGACCGNDICQPDKNENCGTCKKDCGACCGDGVCDPDIGEDCLTCPEDCTSSSEGGASTCCGDDDCESDGGENCSNCESDCGLCCGDGTCDPAIEETCDSCEEDCGACVTCPNGECDGDETCESCPEDCGVCCGNGDCSAIETCDDCPEDCGECCGNTHCEDEFEETCETCEIDCGACVCDEGPDGLLPNISVGLADEACIGSVSGLGCPSEYASPEVIGTYVSITFGGKLASSSGSSEEKGCKEALTASGSLGIKASLVYKSNFIEGTISGSGGCEYPLICENPPLFECDEEDWCCGGTGKGELAVGKGWNPKKKFGKFFCGFSVQGSLFGSGGATVKFGPGCGDCLNPSLSVRGGVKASGGGSCGIKILGREYHVGSSISGCGNVGFSLGFVDCQADADLLAGSSLSVVLPGINLWVLSIEPVVLSWEAGDGC